MYPLPKTPLPSTSGFVPRPTPTFQPIAPDTSPETVNTHNPQNIETSPESSLPCGQQTPVGSTSTSSTPSQHTLPQSVVPPQLATPQSHHSNNTPPHTQPQKTPQSSPMAPPKQQSPVGTNTNPATQPSIPAAVTHQPVSIPPPQLIPKSANGEGVKNSKPESRSSAPDGRLCFCCKQQGHLKKDCPEQLYCSRCRTQGHVPARCPARQQGNKPNEEGCEFWENSQSHETRKEE